MGNVQFTLVEKGCSVPVLVEHCASEGIKRIAEKSANDVLLVAGVEPEIISSITNETRKVVLYATIGESALLAGLQESGKLDIQGVEGKREVFGIRIVEKPWEGVEQALVVYGSEKRGTIYGIFTLSEKIGVSPLLFFGDVKPVHKDEIVFDENVEMVSKEPSVRYRGFFINDEWPCFGNWAFSHFDGFTAKMYDHVYELLLRLKGNYLWPAMWSSSFALDGPGEESARLADIYGVIMGNSHHEPCLRASEEWDIYRGKDTQYGNEWNYVTNKEGLLRYWADGIKGRSVYENIVTMGMRGERDSMMQGTQTLKDNIDVLKDIITNQKELLAKYAKRDMPMLLAIYKEVERYFYGDKETEGLRQWEGLDSIILMLCEDNFGNMRTLPDEAMKKHKGGYGMYYHFDYHGSPISYEWVNSTALSKVWEQMTECYEYGVREVWMVNVGDLKGNEFPLSYFLDMAYDFDKWGSKNLESPHEYTEYWLRKQFGSVSEELIEQMAWILTEGIYLTGLRKPEALNSTIYHPAHFHEGERILERTQYVQNSLQELTKALPDVCQDGFYSMIAYPLNAAMNLIQMQIYAGMNAHFAGQGKKIANDYCDLITASIRKDQEYASEFATRFDGKWSGMELGKHIGFTKWNEDGCRYPLRIQVEPFSRPRMVVSRKDSERICVKNYGQPDEIIVRDFLYPGNESVVIEIANDGIGSYECQIEAEECEWFVLDWKEKNIENQELLNIVCNPEKLPLEQETCNILITDGDTDVKVVVYGQKKPVCELEPMTFYENDGVVVMLAEHFKDTIPAKNGEWKELRGYGKYGSALKAFPVTESFVLGEGPAVRYQFVVEQAGKYQLQVLSAPANPLEKGGTLAFGFQVNDGLVVEAESVDADYCGGEPSCVQWCEGVLNQNHKKSIPVVLKKGVNDVTIYAMDAGFVLEELLIIREDVNVPNSYMGPLENWFS